MHDEADVRRSALWGRADEWPTARQRTGVQHAVARVLDALAPERAPARAGDARLALQRFRSPRGCILQGAGAAVSVTWYAAASNDTGLGELQVIAWDGVVSLPGAARRAAGGARARSEALLRPVEAGPEDWAWSAPDGAVLDTDALVSHCLGLLEAPDRPADAVAAGA